MVVYATSSVPEAALYLYGTENKEDQISSGLRPQVVSKMRRRRAAYGPPESNRPCPSTKCPDDDGTLAG